MVIDYKRPGARECIEGSSGFPLVAISRPLMRCFSSLAPKCSASRSVRLYTDLARFIPAVMKPLRSRSQRARRGRSADWKPLSIILLIVTIPTLGTIILVLFSSRPTLSDRTFSSFGDREGVNVVDWPKLYRLSQSSPEPDWLSLDFARSAVRVPGYMLPFQQSPDHEGKVGEFLLVPDPGNWLHPPHLDPGEVVFVRMSGGLRTPLLNREPVWVEGRLSPHFVNKGSLERAFELIASSVWEIKDGK
jgi:hypothetical protein